MNVEILDPNPLDEERVDSLEAMLPPLPEESTQAEVLADQQEEFDGIVASIDMTLEPELIRELQETPVMKDSGTSDVIKRGSSPPPPPPPPPSPPTPAKPYKPRKS